MFGALKTVEDHNLYASFGLVDGLSENELTDINGGDCTLSICFTCSFSIFGGSKSGDNSSGGYQDLIQVQAQVLVHLVVRHS